MLIAEPHRAITSRPSRPSRLAVLALAAGLLLLAAGTLLTYVTVIEADRARRALPGANRDPRPVHSIPYAEGINRAGRRHGVNPALLAALVAAESRFDPRARSARGALGLTQILPSTWADLRTAVACAQEDAQAQACLLDPETSLHAGALYLRRLLDRYGGDAVLALAAYNAGAARVDARRAPPPFAETAGYLRRVGQAWSPLQRTGTLSGLRRTLILGDGRWPPLRGPLLAGGALLVALAIPWLRRRSR